MTVALWLLLGLLTLLAGAELLVRGAARGAILLGLSPLFVGLTIVSFGTSSPEMAVSLKAVYNQQPDFVLGTNVGSTIFNTLFILGFCAVAAPLVVTRQLIRLDVPIMLAAHLLLLYFSLKGALTKLDGGILLSSLIAYTFFIYRQSKGTQNVSSAKEKGFKPFLASIFCVIFGLILCVYGAQWFLRGAIETARYLDLSELVIAITLVAGGTSLPEVATSLVATIRGERDIAIGNVVGSNIFNILGIVGTSALIADNGITVSPAIIHFDLPVAIACCFACLPIFFTGHRISRWEGWLFLGYYFAYTSYLILQAKEHDALPLFSFVMLWFIIPLTVLTLSVMAYRHYKKV